MPLDHSPVIKRVIGCAIDVHRGIGPALLESAYASCLAYRLGHERIRFARQVPLPVVFEDVRIDCGFNVPRLVDGVKTFLNAAAATRPQNNGHM